MPRLWPQVRETADVRKGLVLDLPFDWGDTSTVAFDRSGYGNHGAIYGARWVDTPLGRALQSDGISDYIDVPSFTLPQTFTITLWMRAYRFGVGSFEWALRHIYPGIWYGTTSLTIERNLAGVFRIRGSDGQEYLVSYTPLYDEGVFTFVACLCDGSRLRLYKNAVLVAERSIPAPPVSRTDALRIIWHGGGSSHTTMTARNFRVYDRPLSGNEIERIYALTRPRPWPRTAAPLVQWGGH